MDYERSGKGRLRSFMCKTVSRSIKVDKEYITCDLNNRKGVCDLKI